MDKHSVIIGNRPSDLLQCSSLSDLVLKSLVRAVLPCAIAVCDYCIVPRVYLLAAGMNWSALKCDAVKTILSQLFLN